MPALPTMCNYRKTGMLVYDKFYFQSQINIRYILIQITTAVIQFTEAPTGCKLLD